MEETEALRASPDEIRQFVVNSFLFGRECDAPTDDASFLESGIIDSTGVLELIGFIEGRYRIKLDDEDLVPENLDSVSRVVAFVKRKLQV